MDRRHVPEKRPAVRPVHFCASLLFVFPCRRAHESWAMPIAILLVIRGVLGAFQGSRFASRPIIVRAIGLISLSVCQRKIESDREFAKLAHDRGESTSMAHAGARMRLRPF